MGFIFSGDNVYRIGDDELSLNFKFIVPVRLHIGDRLPRTTEQLTFKFIDVCDRSKFTFNDPKNYKFDQSKLSLTFTIPKQCPDDSAVVILPNYGDWFSNTPLPDATIQGINQVNGYYPLTVSLCELKQDSTPLNNDLEASFNQAKILKFNNCSTVQSAAQLNFKIFDNKSALIKNNVPLCSTIKTTGPLNNKLCSFIEQLLIKNTAKCSIVESASNLTVKTNESKDQLTVKNKSLCSNIDDSSKTVHSFISRYWSETIPGNDYIPLPFFSIEQEPQYDDGRLSVYGQLPVFEIANTNYTPIAYFKMLENTWQVIGNSHNMSILTQPVFKWYGKWSKFYNSDSYQLGGVRLKTCNIIGDSELTPVKFCSVVEETRSPPNGLTPWIDPEIPPIDPEPPTGETIIVPIKEVYKMINIIQATLNDGTNIDVNNIQITSSTEQHSRSFSCDLVDVNQLVEFPTTTTPTELNVLINGVQWKFIIEKIAQSITFGKDKVSLGGRGVSALLDSPYQDVTSVNFGSDATVQQIVEQIVPSGWVIDWNVNTWLVNGGAYSYQNKSPIQAIKDICDKIGSVLVPDRVSKILHINPRYSVMPWDFNSVASDIIIPHNILTAYTKEPTSNRGVNGVYCHGSNIGGELALVRLTGSAGDVLAQTINNSLMTDSIAIRQIGSKVIADNAEQPEIRSFSTFFDNVQVPLIDTGNLISIVDGQGGIVKGITNSLTITATFEKVSQSVTLGSKTANDWALFETLIKPEPTLIGNIVNTDGKTSLMTMLDGGVMRVNGTGTIGLNYYIKDGAITDKAPDLTQYEIII